MSLKLQLIKSFFLLSFSFFHFLFFCYSFLLLLIYNLIQFKFLQIPKISDRSYVRWKKILRQEKRQFWNVLLSSQLVLTKVLVNNKETAWCRRKNMSKDPDKNPTNNKLTKKKNRLSSTPISLTRDWINGLCNFLYFETISRNCWSFFPIEQL